MAYRLVVIDGDRYDELMARVSALDYYTSKADIHGICIALSTENREHFEMWVDNFYHMSDSVRSHARIFCIDDPLTDLHAEYETSTRTMFLFNFDYYGWVKSIALGMAGNILEDSHSIHSVHGAALEIDGVGVTLIAPSKTGKTTQSWGLLRDGRAHLITDDWYFVSLGRDRPLAQGSEKNCYIDADIGDVWGEYKPLVDKVRFDQKGRGIGNIRWIAGDDAMAPDARMGYIFLLERDPSVAPGAREIPAEEAFEYLDSNGFCNPHQLLFDDRRVRSRKEFFRRYLESCETFMVNTTMPPEETQAEIRRILSSRCRL